jgi:TRAP-type C4-dicarboxylate transport system permease large subunit
VLPLVSIFGVVVGAMAAGWGTPTESAAVGALATIVLALVYRALSWKILLASLKGTVAISAMILFIIVGATTFAQILSFSGASNGLAQAITGSGLAPWAVIMAMMAMLIFLGIFVDQVSMMLITLPIFMPVVQALGIDLDLVRRAVPDLHADGPAAAAARPAADDDEGCRPIARDHARHLPAPSCRSS